MCTCPGFCDKLIFYFFQGTFVKNKIFDSVSNGAKMENQLTFDKVITDYVMSCFWTTCTLQQQPSEDITSL